MISKKNGNSIFLPASGYRDGGRLISHDSNGRYWSSALSESYVNYAYYHTFSSSGHYTYRYYRYYGLPVRPVAEP